MDRRADYYVFGTIKTAHTTVENILCQVFLPERMDDKPKMSFHPTKEQYGKIVGYFHGSFSAENTIMEGKKDVSIIAPIVYFTNAQRKLWGDRLVEYSLDGEPQDLMIKKHLDTDDGEENISIDFFLSPNDLISPVIIETADSFGNIEMEKSCYIKMPIDKNTMLTFDKCFAHCYGENGECLRRSYFVARVNITEWNKTEEKINEILLPIIDDILLIAGIGARMRTGCLGWKTKVRDSNVEYFRGNYSFPTGYKELTLDQGLVSKGEFQKFISECYKNFTPYSNKEALRKAMYALIPSNKRTLEEDYLAIFSGLEALLLDYRRKNQMEYVVEPDTWRTKIKPQVKDNLSTTLKHIDAVSLTDEQRWRMYQKLDELNRISLQTGWGEFCTAYKIEIKDLWPVFKNEDTIGLAEIRNWLIHGEPIPKEAYSALGIARNCLKWTLERAVVSILGFPVCATEVNPDFLKGYAGEYLGELPIHQKAITEALYLRG